MDTIEVAPQGRRRRRRHSVEFKAHVVQACRHPGVSIASVAQAHGLNANLLRRWLIQRNAVAPSLVALQPALRVDKGSTAPRSDHGVGELAHARGRGVCGLAARVLAVIRIDALWMGVEPVDMRAGADTLLARVVQVFGAAQAHHGYLFANARSTRIKLLVHDGFGVWCAARRLNSGRFVWPRQVPPEGVAMTLTPPQFDAWCRVYRWQRLEQMRVATRM